MAKRANNKPLKEVTLSTGVVVRFNELNPRVAQDLILDLSKSDIVDSNGNIVDVSNTDNLTQGQQFSLVENVMTMIDTIIAEENVVLVDLPDDDSWLRSMLRKGYVRRMLKEIGIVNNKEVYEDEDLKRMLYIRYYAIGNDDDFNAILNNTLLYSDEQTSE